MVSEKNAQYKLLEAQATQSDVKTATTSGQRDTNLQASGSYDLLVSFSNGNIHMVSEKNAHNKLLEAQATQSDVKTATTSGQRDTNLQASGSYDLLVSFSNGNITIVTGVTTGTKSILQSSSQDIDVHDVIPISFVCIYMYIRYIQP